MPDLPSTPAARVLPRHLLLAPLCLAAALALGACSKAEPPPEPAEEPPVPTVDELVPPPADEPPVPVVDDD